MPKRMIGLHGKARAGKSTAAKMLIDRGYADYEYAFAQPFKNMCKALGIDPADPYWEANKTKPIPLLGGRSYRQIMQSLGTDWGREFLGEDVWVRFARQIQQTMPDQTMLISDVRHDNEADFVKSNGGLIIEITSPNPQEVHSHVSESGIDPRYIDFTVINDGTLEQLDLVLKGIMDGFETRKQIFTKDK